MHIEEFGKENEKIIVMLHGANFVHSFGKQYELAQKYHLIIPHLMGYGNETDVIFDSDKQVELLVNYISSLGQKVLVIGFSLGAQVGFKLVSEHPTLFSAAILVSPWLDKNEAMIEYVMKQKAGHNIPIVCSKQFNELIVKIMGETVYGEGVRRRCAFR